MVGALIVAMAALVLFAGAAAYGYSQAMQQAARLPAEHPRRFYGREKGGKAQGRGRTAV